MSLLSEAMENFIKLKKTIVDDGYGGTCETYSDDFGFEGALAFNSSIEAQVAQLSGVTGIFTLTTERGILLNYHDVIKRVRDGKTYRVTTDGSFSRTPLSASLNMRQVVLEQWSIPVEDSGEEDDE